MSISQRLFITLQHLLPQHALSRCVGRLASCETPWLKNLLIRQFIRQFKVDMQQAERPAPESYIHFNDFFTRTLIPGARPIDSDPLSIACPADGAVSQAGRITHGRIFQAKGQDYSLTDLLGGCSERASAFQNGHFATIYLSPRDYHRVHMPLAGTLRESIYVPGQLFSVNRTTAQNVPGLFARNERLVCIFDTEAGPMAVVLVGAMIVAGIETVWAGEVAPVRPRLHAIDHQSAPDRIQLDKGAEMGLFKLGSTAIVLFGEDVAAWTEHLNEGQAVRMGEVMGHYQPAPTRHAD